MDSRAGSEMQLRQNTGALDKRIDEIIGNAVAHRRAPRGRRRLLSVAILYLLPFGGLPSNYRVFRGEPSDLRHVSRYFSARRLRSIRADSFSSAFCC